MVRDSASTATSSAGYLLPAHRRNVGNVDSFHGRPMAADADLQRNHARSRFSEALALTARYRGQSVIGIIGAGGAVGLLVAYGVVAGHWG